MKESYSTRPERTWLEVLNEKPGAECVLHFAENITEHDRSDEDGITQKEFEADHYQIVTGFREGLLETVEANRAVWLAAAKTRETKEENKTLKTRVRELEESKGAINEALDDVIASILEG